MTTIPEYLTISRASTKGIMDDPALGQLLTDQAGFARAEIETHAAQLQPIEAAYNRLLNLAATQKRCTDALLVALADIKSEISLLRQVVSDNFKRDDPILTQIGFDTALPRGQTDLLIYAARAFTNAQTLPAPQAALLAQRTWDAARFTAALAKVASVQTLNDEQENAKSESVAATGNLYTLIDEFDAWFRPFAKAAIRHLDKGPGALAKLGLAAGLPGQPVRPTEKNPGRKKPATPPA